MPPLIRLIAAVALLLAGSACDESTRLAGPTDECVVPNEYIVLLDRGLRDPRRTTDALAAKHGFEVKYVWESLRGFSARMDARTAAALAREPGVLGVSPNYCFTLDGALFPVAQPSSPQ